MSPSLLEVQRPLTKFSNAIQHSFYLNTSLKQHSLITTWLETSLAGTLFKLSLIQDPKLISKAKEQVRFIADCQISKNVIRESHQMHSN